MGNEAKRRNQLTCARIRVFDSISSNWFEVRFYLRISWLHQPSSKASWETRRRCFETLKSVSDEEWKTKQYIAHFASRCAATRVRVVWRNGMTRLRCSSTSRHAQRLTNFWVSRGDAALEFAICNMLWQQLQALGFQRAFWGIACLVLLPSHCNDSSLYLSFSNVCKATSVTHTKRIYRDLLRKETSFVCYTSSVLIQIDFA